MGGETENIDKIMQDAEEKEKDSNQILDFTREIKNINEEDKIIIIEALWDIIYSDEDADMYETNLMRRLSGLLYLDPKIVGDDTIITYSFIPNDKSNQYFVDSTKEAGHRPQIGTDNVFGFSNAHKQATRTILEEFENKLIPCKGEFVILLEGKKDKTLLVDLEVENVMRELIRELPISKAADIASRLMGQSRKNLYKCGLELKNKL